MAKFVKGQIANPLGQKAHDPIKKAYRKITDELFRDVLDAALKGDMKKLKTISMSRNRPALEVGVAKSIYQASLAGNWGVLQSIIDRLVGKPKEQIEITAIKEEPIEIVKARFEEHMRKLKMIDG